MTVFHRFLPMMLICLLMLSACSPAPPADDFAYALTAFTTSVRGTYTPADGVPRPIAATVSVGEPSAGGGPADRPMTMTFTQPPALAGLTVSSVFERDSQGQSLRTVTFTYPSAYGEVKVTSQEGDLDGFLRFAEALLPLGDIAEVSPTAEDGTHTVTRRTADGTREAVYLFSAEQALPLRVKITDRARDETIDLAGELIQQNYQ